MEKKYTTFKIDSFRKDFILFSHSEGSGFDKQIFQRHFSEEEINQLENHFEQFYKLLLKNCLEIKLKSILKKFKDELKNIYFYEIWVEIGISSPYALVCKEDKTLLNNKELRKGAILSAEWKLFFFADVVIAFVMGNDEKLRAIMDELNKSRYELNLRKSKQSNSRKLKPEDISYQRNMTFVDEMLNGGLTKYAVVKRYKDNDGRNLKASEKSISNAFDSFLKSHKEEIKKKQSLTEKNFIKSFFPASLSKK